jgi:hypothetical protein
MTEPTPNYLEKILRLCLPLERGHVYYAAVFHDDWCASNLTRNFQDCNCKPIVRLHLLLFTVTSERSTVTNCAHADRGGNTRSAD